MTRIETYKGLIVGYRAPVLHGGKKGKEEKSPIHVADIVRMCGISTSSPKMGSDPADKIKGVLKQKVPAAAEVAGPKLRSAEERGDYTKSVRVRFELQESDQDGHERPRRVAGGHNSSAANSGSSDSTMRSAHDAYPLTRDNSRDNFELQDTRSDPNRSVWPAHKMVHDAAHSQESADGLLPSRTVTRYDANSSEAAVDRPID